MRIRCFADTDTLHVALRDAGIVETRDLDDDTPIDVDAPGRTCAITLEHARSHADVERSSVEVASSA
jgi:uncharacterized protein YuzE